ncbi:hypothetical protein TNCV_3584681 [Trichonephila clavipes]|nr:hypothetical protein TNCV_3584681 [Trichonephila clavipes]
MIMWIPPQLYGKDILEFDKNTENVIDAESNNENEINNVAHVPTSSEVSNMLKIVRVHYFVRGGFVGYRSRASSKHLSSLIFRSGR